MTTIIVFVLLAGFTGLMFYLNKRVKDIDPSIIPQQKLRKAKTAQEFLGFEAITRDLLVVDEHRYRAFLKVDPINFYLYSDTERDGIQAAFKEALETQSGSFQLYLPSLRADHRKKMNQIVHQAQSMPGILSLYAENLKDFTNNWVQEKYPLTRGHYIILNFNHIPDKKHPMSKKEVFKKAETELSIRLAALKDALDRAGLKGERLTSSEIASLIFSVYNRDRSRYIDINSVEQDGVMTLISTSLPKMKFEFEAGEGVPEELMEESERADQLAIQAAIEEKQRYQEEQVKKEQTEALLQRQRQQQRRLIMEEQRMAELRFETDDSDAFDDEDQNAIDQDDMFVIHQTGTEDGE